jgi:DNA primase
MRIPDSKIDDVRAASDIVDVISSYLSLRKRGKNYLGLCPFHKEKTPSFNVSPERQMYHCFGCGAGGNVFTFVMEHEKVSFVEAVRTLAERAGIALPTGGPDDRAQATEIEALYDVCRKAELHFHQNMTSTVEGKLALEYLHHRGFTDDTIKRFVLGYSMHSWDDVIQFAANEGVDVGLVEKAGLVVKKEDGSGYYDRFRGRVMFPILSPSGRTIGFGARKLREDDTLAKYINSPETPIYNKSRILYGLFQSKEALRAEDNAILVEGYADLLSVFQSGVQNVVASSGTALTEEQIQLVGRYTKNVTLVYDADSAGSKATMRGVDLIIESGLDVKVAALPEGEDPDSFVRKHGRVHFQQLIDKAMSFLDFKAKQFQDQGFFATPEGQTRAVRSIVETIAKMKDELKRNFYIKSVSERYGIYESVLYRELEKLVSQSKARESFERARAAVPSAPSAEVPQAGTLSEEPLPAIERDLLKVMLENGNEMVRKVLSSISIETFSNVRARALAQVLARQTDERIEWHVDGLLNEMDDSALRRFVADVVFSKYEISKGWAALGAVPDEPDPWMIADRCLMLIRRRDVDGRIAENQRHMKAAATRGEDTRPYLEHHQSLLGEKKELDRLQVATPDNKNTDD